jgi:putative hydrolase of the HAD superfamily
MKAYRHIFFDLDHTLWDFEKNSQETIYTLYDQFGLHTFGMFDCTDFYKKYSYVNYRMWRLYNLGKIGQQELRETRFEMTLTKLGLTKEQIPVGLSEAYLSLCPTKTAVFPFAHETLQYLHPKYDLHILTNGFKDVQHIKLSSSNLQGYFKEIITSECSGFKKPDPECFAYALSRANVMASECLMIGDNLEADILGAKNAGIDQVFFNPEKKRHFQRVTHEIQCLSELMQLL